MTNFPIRRSPRWLLRSSSEEDVLCKGSDPEDEQHGQEQPKKPHAPHHSATHHILHHEMPLGVQMVMLWKCRNCVLSSKTQKFNSDTRLVGYFSARNVIFPTTACRSPGTMAAMRSSQRPIMERSVLNA